MAAGEEGVFRPPQGPCYADLRDKVAYYLAHPEERARIAANARAHVTAHHTYDQRMARLMAEVARLRG